MDRIATRHIKCDGGGLPVSHPNPNCCFIWKCVHKRKVPFYVVCDAETDLHQQWGGNCRILG